MTRKHVAILYHMKMEELEADELWLKKGEILMKNMHKDLSKFYSNILKITHLNSSLQHHVTMLLMKMLRKNR